MKTAINLYTVRELDDSMPTLLERVADAGYDGVQFSGDLQESSPEEVAATLSALDLEVTGIHVDGNYAIDELLDGVPDLGFEIDVGWVATAGADPREYVERYADRIEMVHMKDMATDSGEFREIGQGDVDMGACADAARAAGAEWLIYEHDDPDDPVESIKTGAVFLSDLK